MFLATPHRGANKQVWADIARRLSSLVRGGATSTEAAKEIEVFSNTLTDINRDFVNIVNNYKIVSFLETQGTFHTGLVSC